MHNLRFMETEKESKQLVLQGSANLFFKLEKVFWFLASLLVSFLLSID